MTRKDYFDFIYATCKSDSDKVVELLLARGFLLEFVDGIYYLSDNNHKSDKEYLKKILEQYNIGTVDDEKIIISNPSRYFVLEEEFQENKIINYEVCTNFYGWDYFKHREHGHKVMVEDLEPFIGRYVKALSSAGVNMVGSCDGNHSNSRYAILQYGDCGSSTWHALICEVLDENNIHLDWGKKGKLYFSSLSKYDVYYKLNEAAKFIYENRKMFRSIKQSALKNYSTVMLKETDSVLIANDFMKEARKLMQSKS